MQTEVSSTYIAGVLTGHLNALKRHGPPRKRTSVSLKSLGGSNLRQLFLFFFFYLCSLHVWLSRVSDSLVTHEIASNSWIHDDLRGSSSAYATITSFLNFYFILFNILYTVFF